MNKGDISITLRKTGVLYLTDWIRYCIQWIKNKKKNNLFRKKYPEVKLPPDYLMYESFQLNYNKYYTESRETARWLKGNLTPFTDLENKKILDWGCGPGRVIRHLPEVINNNCEFHGTDYNARSIAWCEKNIEGIHFNHNSLEAFLPYRDNFFDIIYGISIFTHLSERMHYDWYDELHRVLKPGGIMFLTTQGQNFTVKLTKKELEDFNQGRLIVRGRVKEGHRTYSAFHPVGFMTSLFSNVKIEAHTAPEPQKGKWLPQDIWIIRKQ